jgi:hypothetical protein
MSLPLKKLIAEKKVRTEGERRATRYFPFGGKKTKGAIMREGMTKRRARKAKKLARAGSAKKQAKAPVKAEAKRAETPRVLASYTVEDMVALIENSGSKAAAAKAIGVSPSTFKDRAKALGL